VPPDAARTTVAGSSVAAHDDAADAADAATAAVAAAVAAPAAAAASPHPPAGTAAAAAVRTAPPRPPTPSPLDCQPSTPTTANTAAAVAAAPRPRRRRAAAQRYHRRRATVVELGVGPAAAGAGIPVAMVGGGAAAAAGGGWLDGGRAAPTGAGPGRGVARRQRVRQHRGETSARVKTRCAEAPVVKKRVAAGRPRLASPPAPRGDGDRLWQRPQTVWPRRPPPLRPLARGGGGCGGASARAAPARGRPPRLGVTEAPAPAWPPRQCCVTAGGSPTERRTESLLGNSRTEGHLLGPSVREQAPPFCSAPPLVCLVVQFLYCQELARVTALLIMINELLKVY